MNVTFEKKDALNGSLSVGITKEDYLPGYETKLKNYSKKANIPGFRAGHAPKSMIEKMVGNSMLLEEINNLASKSLFDYIDQHKLNILGQPVLSEDTKVDELNKDAEYTFRFDMGFAPEIELNIGKGDVFVKYKALVPETAIDEEITRMKKRFGQLTNAEIASENDMVYLELTELLEDGSPLEGGVHADSVPVAINTIKDENLRNELIGKSVGANMRVNLFTLFNHDESEMGHALGIQKQTVADLSPDFSLSIKEIKATQEAELNQELFDKLYPAGDVKTEEDFRNRVREELSSYYDQQAQHLLEHELFDSLVEKHQIELPDAFLKRWLMDRHADKFNAENVDQAYKPEANYLRNHILEEKIMSSNGIKVDDAEIKEAALNHTRQMFGAYGNHGLSEELLMSIVEPQLQKEDFRSRMINVAVRQKVNAWLMDAITIDIKEVSTEEFVKVMELHNAKHHHQHEHEPEHEHETA